MSPRPGDHVCSPSNDAGKSMTIMCSNVGALSMNSSQLITSYIRVGVSLRVTLLPYSYSHCAHYTAEHGTSIVVVESGMTNIS